MSFLKSSFFTTSQPQQKPVEEILRLLTSNNPTTHLFKIENFSLLKKYNVLEVESSVFDIGGYKWTLYVRPFVPEVSGERYVYICLMNQVPLNVMLEYELFVVSQLKTTWYSTGKRVIGKSPINNISGSYRLIPLVDLEKNGYLIGDCCIFGVKLYGIRPAISGTAEYFSLIEKPLNYKVTWMISNFSSVYPGSAHYSKEFVVGNRKWRIKVHPRGYCMSKEKSFSLDLCGVGFVNNAPRANTLVKYKLCVLDQVNRDHIEREDMQWFGQDDSDFMNFMPLEKVAEPYLVNDTLYVGVEFKVISVNNYCYLN